MKKLFIKKLFCSFLLISLFCINITFNVEANDKTEDIKSQNAISEYDRSIKNNLDKLIKQAKNNNKNKKADKIAKITDNKGQSYGIPLLNISTDEVYNGDNKSIMAITYAFDLSEKADSSAVSNTLKSTFSEPIPPSLVATKHNESVIATESTLLNSSGNTYLDKWDNSLGVLGYCTIYYSISTDSYGVAIYNLTKVTGGYTISDSSISVSSQNLVYGAVGTGPTGMVNNSNTKTPTSSSWSYNTGYSKYIAFAGYYTFGATYTLNLSRTTSNWSLTLNNLL